MKSMRYWIALMLILVMCIGMMPGEIFASETELTEQLTQEEEDSQETLMEDETSDAFSATGTCGENLIWTLDEEGVLTISGSGAMTDYSSVDSVPWYNYQSSIKKIIIQSGVTNISDYSFYHCQIGEISIPNSVNTIGYAAFHSCNKLQKIEIPQSVTDIEANVFNGCSSLVSIDVADDNMFYSSIDGVLYSSDQSILIQYPDNYPKSSYVIPDSVVSIGQGAFDDCYTLEHLTIPSSVVSFEYSVLSGCRKLISAGPLGSGSNIEYGWDSIIPSRAFYGSSIKTMIISSSISNIGSEAFRWCNALTDVYCDKDEAAWNQMLIDYGNDNLLGAIIHLGDGTTIEPEPSEPKESMSMPEPIGTPVEIDQKGDGTLDNPYRITSAEEFAEIWKDPDAWYVLAADITVSKMSYIDFEGVFDGNHHTITVTGDAAAGLFRNNMGTITQLNINVYSQLTSDAEHNNYVGIISSVNEGIILDCTVQGTLRITYTSTGGWLSVGGVAGTNWGKIKRCWSALDISVDGLSYDVGARTSNQYIGGIAGECKDYGSVFMCLNSGDIDARYSENITKVGFMWFHVGGIVGNVSDHASIKSCIQAGKEIAMTGTFIGDRVITPSGIEYYLFLGSVYSIKSGFVVGGEYAYGSVDSINTDKIVKDCIIHENSKLNVDLHDCQYYCWFEKSYSPADSSYSTYSYNEIKNWWNNMERDDPEDHFSSSSYQSVCYFREWDAEKQTAYFGDRDSIDLGSQVTEETDTSFIEYLDELLGQYVLVETKSRVDSYVDSDALISIKAIESNIGTVSSSDPDHIVIDGVSYDIPENLSFPTLYENQLVLYHLCDEELVGIITLYEKKGTLTYWNTSTRRLNIDPDNEDESYPSYILNVLADKETVDYLGETGVRRSAIQFICDDRDFIYRVVGLKPVTVASGDCGDELTWTLDEKGTLTISGIGAMYDYNYNNGAPWDEYESVQKIYNIVIEEEVTSIGSCAFVNQGFVNTIDVQASLKSIGEGAFDLTGTVSSGLQIHFDADAPENVALDAFGAKDGIDIYFDAGTDINGWNDVISRNYTNHSLAFIYSENASGKLSVSNRWSFPNEEKYFGGKENGYYITKTDYDKLMSNLNKTEQKALNSCRENKTIFSKNLYNVEGENWIYYNWQGSCYGMTALAVLVKNGIRSVNDFSNSNTLFSVYTGNDSLPEGIQSVINFYVWQQRIPAVLDAKKSFMLQEQSEQLKKLEELVSSAESRGNVALISFAYKGEEYDEKDKQQKVKDQHHTIIGYAIEKGHFNVEIDNIVYQFDSRILTYDSKYAGNGQRIHDGAIYYNYMQDQWAIPGYNVISTSNNLDITSSNDTAQLELVITDANYINAIDYVTGEKNYNLVSENAYLYTDNDTFVVQSDMETDIFEDRLFNGNSTISDNESVIIATSAETDSSVADVPYAIAFSNLDSDYTVLSSTEDIDFSLGYGDCYLSAMSDQTGSVKFESDGKVSLTADEKGNNCLSVTVNDGWTNLVWDTVTISVSDSKEISSEMTDDGVVIISDNLDDITITVSDNDTVKERSFSLDETKIMISEKDNEIAVFKDSDGDGIYDKDITNRKKIKIISQPQDTHGTIGTWGVFQVQATGSGLTYQWRYSYDGEISDESYYILRKSSDTMTRMITKSTASATYWCHITDAYGYAVNTESCHIQCDIQDGYMANGVCGDNISWTLDDTGLMFVEGSGVISEDSISWSDYCDEIEAVIFRGDITEIGDWAFYGAGSLSSIYFPDTLVKIGDYAFKNTWPESLVFPESLEEIGEGAFENTLAFQKQNKPLVLPDGLKKIGAGAFYQSDADVITVPDSVEEIGENAFYGVKTIWCKAGSYAETYVKENGCLYEIVEDTGADAAIFSGTCGDNAAWAFDGSTGILSFSGSGEMESYQEDYPAWYDLRHGITEVEVGEGITTIGYDAFYHLPCLQKVTLPESLTTIETRAFKDCSRLALIIMKCHAPEVGTNVFDGTAELIHLKYPAEAEGYDSGVWAGMEQETYDYDMGNNTENPFVDVAETSYYYDAVLWAYEKGITTGKDAAHFLPDSTCTRAQVVTFLWRAKGEPEPAITENPFEDVKTTDYYYKAVLWAYENGITTGKDTTHFLPGTTVTRNQFVTFLWRAEGKPAASISNPFVDVPDGQYYTTAVLWAYENGVTTGKDAAHFQPENGCTRAQVAAFLYRAYNQGV